MLPIYRKTVLLNILLILVIFNPTFTWAGDMNGIPAEGKPAYKLKEVTSFMKDIIPLIEEASGRKFLKTPTIKLVNRQKMAKILQAEFKPLLKGMYLDYSDPRLNQLSLQQAAALAPAIMGKYGLLDRNLYLLPKNLVPLLEMAKVDSKHTHSILKLVVIHELVHALQDQQTDLKRYWNMTNMDEINAFQATIEGHAVFIQDYLGRQMGLDDSVIEMSRLLSAGSVIADDPAQEIVRKLIATQYEQIYLGGKKFVEYHFKQGGNEKIWDIIAKPPVKTAMIAHPDTYSPVKQAQINYATLLEGLVEELEEKNWRVKNTELGEMAIRSVYAKIPETDREEIISNVEHVQTFLAQSVYPPCMVNISAIVLKNGKISKKYITLLEEMAQQNIEELKSSNTMKISGFSITDFNGIDADISREIAFTISGANEEDPQELLFVRIARGDLILEFFISNYAIEDSVIVLIAEKVFERYRQLLNLNSAIILRVIEKFECTC